MSSAEIWVCHLGVVDYREALALQERVREARQEGSLPDVLLLLEHPPVVTLGRGADESNLVFPREALAARGVEVAETDRGGDVTFHGPGQLVGYPILDLHRHRQDLHWYLRTLEQALINALELHPGEEGLSPPAWWKGPGVPVSPVARAWSKRVPARPGQRHAPGEWS